MFKTLMLTAASLAVVSIATPAIAGNYGDKDSGTKAEKMADLQNIVETAAANENFSTLVAAVKAADLVEALSSEGPFTVFAPTNEAFAALPEGTLDDLLKPENKEQLQGILKYHVVSGKIKSGDIASGETNVNTLQGSAVNVVKGDAGVTVNGAKVTSADIKTSNGVIHVIDTVILPQ